MVWSMTNSIVKNALCLARVHAWAPSARIHRGTRVVQCALASGLLDQRRDQCDEGGVVGALHKEREVAAVEVQHRLACSHHP